MRQIISIQVGQCGNAIGSSFWEAISKEHGLDNSGVYVGQSDYELAMIGTYFQEHNKGVYIPRALFTDLESRSIKSIQSQPIPKMLRPNQFVLNEQSGYGAGNNWSYGYYNQNALNLVEELMEAIRSSAQRCDLLQGFQLSHSLGAGTGSGMGSRLITELRQHYFDRTIETFSVFPSPYVSDTVVEPYNAGLCINRLIEDVDNCFMIDNQALYSICGKHLNIQSPTYGDLNKLITRTMSGVTCSRRFPGQLNSDMRKLSANMNPVPRLHFLTVGSSFTSQSQQENNKIDVPKLVGQIFNKANIISAEDTKPAKYFAGTAVFRGSMPQKSINHQIKKVTDQNSKDYVQNIPPILTTSFCAVPYSGYQQNMTFLGNSTAVRGTFERIEAGFSAMFKRKAFLKCYHGQGMDEMQMYEAQEQMQQLISEYVYYEQYDYEEETEGNSQK